MNGDKVAISSNLDRVVTWILENAFTPEKLATLLVLIFLFMFMGILPSPMLSANLQAHEEHQAIMWYTRQICINTSKDQAAVNSCFYRKE